MTMSSYDRVRRQQLLREAEGYLDLILAFADQWPPRAETRDRLARRALEILKDVEQSGAEVAYALYLQGQALRAMELYADALAPLRDSADSDPTNIHVWLALGWCYKRIRRIDNNSRSSGYCYIWNWWCWWCNFYNWYSRWSYFIRLKYRWRRFGH